MTGSQPVVLKRKQISQVNVELGNKEIYAVKPGVPSEDERAEHKESMRVDEEELTAALVTAGCYIVES